jgi:imidazolonepropionase-like amidohydrolase
MPRTTRIRNAAWIVAWDTAIQSHGYLNDGDVVFAGDAITFVGKHYAGDADETIDGRDLMVMPGPDPGIS